MNISLIPNETISCIYCSKDDTTLRKWEFELYANNIFFMPEGDISLVCSNGVEIPITKENNKLYCDCTQQLSSKSGEFDCKIKIKKGDELLYSSLFKLIVEVGV